VDLADFVGKQWCTLPVHKPWTEDVSHMKWWLLAVFWLMLHDTWHDKYLVKLLTIPPQPLDSKDVMKILE
jgi:hypothetical protein